MAADGDGSRRAFPRRALLYGGGGALVAAAVGVPLYAALRPTGPSPSPAPSRTRASSPVRQLLATPLFTVAHRGGSADWPEMSLWAYQQSVRAGADALEFSVARTTDGVWFGSHDATLDRVTGSSGFTAADRTWAEIQELRIRPPAAHPDQPARPFLKLEDFVSRFSADHALWIDPKAVDPRYHTGLLDLLAGLVPKPETVFVAKSYCGVTSWGRAARERGWQSWGFYYGKDLAASPTLFSRTRDAWSIYGLDIQATPDQWKTMTATGTPVAAHVLVSRAELSTAKARGAAGAVIADVTAVLG